MLNTCFTSLLAVSADNLALGGQVVLIGLGTVFAVLILLWLCLESALPKPTAPIRP